MNDGDKISSDPIALSGDKPRSSVDELGNRIRLRRKAKRLTLYKVAELSGVSTAQLSQIERGRTIPSVDKLVLLCQALEMPVSWLFDSCEHPDMSQGEARYIIRKAKRRHIEFSKNSMTKDMLTPDATPEIQMMRVVLGPDGTTGDIAYNAKEGAKCGIVLRGSMALEIDGQVYRLFTGDSFAFKAVSMIRFWAEGEESEIIWTVLSTCFRNANQTPSWHLGCRSRVSAFLAADCLRQFRAAGHLAAPRNATPGLLFPGTSGASRCRRYWPCRFSRWRGRCRRCE